MAKSFPGGLMHDFDPALSDRGNAYVGLADVGLNTISFTAVVNSAGNHVLVHSLKATPSFWLITPSGESVNAFVAFPGVTAADASAIYYTAQTPWTTGAATNIARQAKAYIFR